jgi:CRP-like cAMP-binding protein
MEVRLETRSFLASVPFFADVLSAEQIDTLIDGAHRADFDRGATIIRQRDAGDSLFVVMQGSVTVSIRDAGMDRTVATLRSGDIFGEMSLLTGAPRAATVVAQTPAVTLEIDRSAMRPLIDAQPSLSDRFADILETRRAELEQLYGPGFLPFYGRQLRDLGTTIRSYFGVTGNTKPD